LATAGFSLPEEAHLEVLSPFTAVANGRRECMGRKITTTKAVAVAVHPQGMGM
jgi:hypothetical protein